MKVELIDHMGDDLTVVNAARVSMDKESEWTLKDVFDGDGEYWFTDEVLSDRDAKLIKYLAEYNHFTPFTHCTITLRETVPIFVARQRFKHVVGFTYNEVSRRYVDDTPEFYTPDVWRKRAENVKQGSSDEPVEVESFCARSEPSDYGICLNYPDFIKVCADYYQHLLDSGVAPEQARMVLPQSMYTSYYVTGSLYAFARAYLLRIDPHAQKEIRDVAVQWDATIRPLFPHSWSALVDTTPDVQG